MIDWLVSLATKAGLNWLWGKVSQLASWLYLKWQIYLKSREIQKQNDAQAAIVEAIRQQIIALVAAGQPVPPELEEKLIEESRKLNDITLNLHK